MCRFAFVGLAVTDGYSGIVPLLSARGPEFMTVIVEPVIADSETVLFVGIPSNRDTAMGKMTAWEVGLHRFLSRVFPTAVVIIVIMMYSMYGIGHGNADEGCTEKFGE